MMRLTANNGADKGVLVPDEANERAVLKATLGFPEVGALGHRRAVERQSDDEVAL